MVNVYNVKQAPANFWKKSPIMRKGYKPTTYRRINPNFRQTGAQAPVVCMRVCVEGHELKSQRGLALPPSDWHKMEKPPDALPSLSHRR